MQRLHLFLVLVKLAVGVNLDIDGAVGIGLGQFFELGGGLAFWRVGRDDVAELDDDLVLCGGGHGQRQGQRGCAKKRAECATGQHVILLLMSALSLADR